MASYSSSTEGGRQKNKERTTAEWKNIEQKRLKTITSWKSVLVAAIRNLTH